MLGLNDKLRHESSAENSFRQGLELTKRFQKQWEDQFVLFHILWGELDVKDKLFSGLDGKHPMFDLMNLSG